MHVAVAESGPVVCPAYFAVLWTSVHRGLHFCAPACMLSLRSHVLITYNVVGTYFRAIGTRTVRIGGSALYIEAGL